MRREDRGNQSTLLSFAQGISTRVKKEQEQAMLEIL